jgi:regulator of protease activity HflC (stomatin/prohibitin superfamily)
MLWIFLGILVSIALVGLSIWRNSHNSKVEAELARSDASDERKAAFRLQNQFPVTNTMRAGLVGVAIVFFGLGLWNQVFFMAEPGYQYHVRTVTGQERVVVDPGFNYYLFGTFTPWKKAMSVQAVGGAVTDALSADRDANDGAQLSANLPPERVVFLDQVDARVQATVRFLLPTDRESFLRIAREYRSPENLLRTGLIPAFRETLQANASLMGAEEYYSGGRTEFNTEFEAQMKDGIYLVRRSEVRVEDDTAVQAASANVSAGAEQEQFGDGTKVVFQVEKEYNADGTIRRKPQQFVAYGISVIDARITDVNPNQKFIERMELKQQAAADRAIAREQRIQEEEQKLLAEARGAREVAERKAAALVEQVQQTTEAETRKQLALTAAQQELEAAELNRQTSEIRLQQAEIDAQAKVVAADADAYERRAIIEADNALALKLETEQAIQAAWADAFARRNVPSTVLVTGGGVGDAGTPTGSNTELTTMVELMTMQMAERLNYDRGAAAAQK